MNLRRFIPCCHNLLKNQTKLIKGNIRASKCMKDAGALEKFPLILETKNILHYAVSHHHILNLFNDDPKYRIAKWRAQVLAKYFPVGLSCILSEH